MSTTNTYAKTETLNDEQTIRGMIADWARALEARDLDRMMAEYAPDAVLFDAIPPYKLEGAEAIRKAWEGCLPCFPENFKSEHRDIQITVSGDTAFMHAVHHIKPVGGDHPAGATWLRVTAGFRRIAGKWKVAHEHVSIPFNPLNNQAFFITDPSKVEAPDWSNPAVACAASS